MKTFIVFLILIFTTSIFANASLSELKKDSKKIVQVNENLYVINRAGSIVIYEMADNEGNYEVVSKFSRKFRDQDNKKFRVKKYVDLLVNNQYAYAISKKGRVIVFDVSYPTAPKYKGQNGFIGRDVNSISIKHVGNDKLKIVVNEYLYYLFDVSDANFPSIVRYQIDRKKMYMLVGAWFSLGGT